MKKYLLILLFALPILAISQGVLTSSEAKLKAHTQIKMLKNGKLIVRLHSKSITIKLLKDKGMLKRANYIKEEQDKLNLKIVESFKDFKFCKVYFFYSNDSQAIKSGNFNKVKLFLNRDLLAKGVNLDSNFLVADFGNMPGKNNMSMKSMYLMNNKLDLLSNPFPFYIRFHPTPIQSLTHKKVVVRMDKKLFKFYGKK